MSAADVVAPDFKVLTVDEHKSFTESRTVREWYDTSIRRGTSASLIGEETLLRWSLGQLYGKSPQLEQIGQVGGQFHIADATYHYIRAMYHSQVKVVSPLRNLDEVMSHSPLSPLMNAIWFSGGRQVFMRDSTAHNENRYKQQFWTETSMASSRSPVNVEHEDGDDSSSEQETIEYSDARDMNDDNQLSNSNSDPVANFVRNHLLPNQESFEVNAPAAVQLAVNRGSVAVDGPSNVPVSLSRHARNHMPNIDGEDMLSAYMFVLMAQFFSAGRHGTDLFSLVQDFIQRTNRDGPTGTQHLEMQPLVFSLHGDAMNMQEERAVGQEFMRFWEMVKGVTLEAEKTTLETLSVSEQSLPGWMNRTFDEIVSKLKKFVHLSPQVHARIVKILSGNMKRFHHAVSFFASNANRAIQNKNRKQFRHRVKALVRAQQADATMTYHFEREMRRNSTSFTQTPENFDQLVENIIRGYEFLCTEDTVNVIKRNIAESGENEALMSFRRQLYDQFTVFNETVERCFKAKSSIAPLNADSIFQTFIRDPCNHIVMQQYPEPKAERLFLSWMERLSRPQSKADEVTLLDEWLGLSLDAVFASNVIQFRFHKVFGLTGGATIPKIESVSEQNYRLYSLLDWFYLRSISRLDEIVAPELTTTTDVLRGQLIHRMLQYSTTVQHRELVKTAITRLFHRYDIPQSEVDEQDSGILMLMHLYQPMVNGALLCSTEDVLNFVSTAECYEVAFCQVNGPAGELATLHPMTYLRAFVRIPAVENKDQVKLFQASFAFDCFPTGLTPSLMNDDSAFFNTPAFIILRTLGQPDEETKVIETPEQLLQVLAKRILSKVLSHSSGDSKHPPKLRWFNQLRSVVHPARPLRRGPSTRMVLELRDLVMPSRVAKVHIRPPIKLPFMSTFFTPNEGFHADLTSSQAAYSALRSEITRTIERARAVAYLHDDNNKEEEDHHLPNELTYYVLHSDKQLMELQTDAVWFTLCHARRITNDDEMTRKATLETAPQQWFLSRWLKTATNAYHSFTSMFAKPTSVNANALVIQETPDPTELALGWQEHEGPHLFDSDVSDVASKHYELKFETFILADYLTQYVVMQPNRQRLSRSGESPTTWARSPNLHNLVAQIFPGAQPIIQLHQSDMFLALSTSPMQQNVARQALLDDMQLLDQMMTEERRLGMTDNTSLLKQVQQMETLCWIRGIPEKDIVGTLLAQWQNFRWILTNTSDPSVVFCYMSVPSDHLTPQRCVIRYSLIWTDVDEDGQSAPPLFQSSDESVDSSYATSRRFKLVPKSKYVLRQASLNLLENRMAQFPDDIPFWSCSSPSDIFTYTEKRGTLKAMMHFASKSERQVEKEFAEQLAATFLPLEDLLMRIHASQTDVCRPMLFGILMRNLSRYQRESQVRLKRHITDVAAREIESADDSTNV